MKKVFKANNTIFNVRLNRQQNGWLVQERGVYVGREFDTYERAAEYAEIKVKERNLEDGE